MRTPEPRFHLRPSAGSSLKRIIFLAGTALCCFALQVAMPDGSAAQGSTALTETLEIKPEGITVRYPAGWSSARQANLYKLFNVPADKRDTLDAAALDRTPRITLYLERRSDHAEAVRRLKEIEAEAVSPSTFLSIGGWPALQRRHLAPKPQPGQGDILGPVDEKVLEITTAVAAGDLLVRIEGRLQPDAPAGVVDQVEAIGRSATFASQGDPGKVEEEIQDLRSTPPPGSLLMSPAPLAAGAAEGEEASSEELAGATVRVTNQGGTDSELEVAVSPNGRNIVIGTNGNYFFSTNGGQTFGTSNGIAGNDPSLAFGTSGGANGTFYAANIATPSTGLRVSTDNGANFAFRANAYTCGQGGDPACGATFPDQEHIAADRFNVTATGDQVYSAWRHLDGNWGIVCSRDSGNTWSTNGFFTGGDFPRVTLGQDGFVYVVYFSGNNLMIRRFNSCEANQNPMVSAAPQTVVAGSTYVACPTSGLDRCNFRNTLASPMVAVDDTNANHIYVAYAVNTNPGGGGSPTCNNQNTCNENIVVQDSTDGGTTWNAADPNRTVTISNGVVARRFMPWVCAIGGTAHVTWFDRRVATPANNSLTDFFRASASLDVAGNLQAGTEAQVNDAGTADAQCEAGFAAGSVNSWPAVVDRPGDSESCSNQPQPGGRCCILAEIDGSGRCLSPTGASSQTRCDFSDAAGVGTPPCLAGESCASSRGAPKYGDYNGNWCAAGRLYMAWASATAPPGIPASPDIDTFFSSRLVCCVGQIQVPGGVNLGDTCVGSSSTGTLQVCNTGKEDLEVNTITSSNAQFSVTTPSSGYPVVISPDFCFPFQVRFTPTSAGPKSSTLTIPSSDPLNPSVQVTAAGNGTQQKIATLIPNSGNFGNVCVDDFKDLNLTISNSGGCDLTVTDVMSSSTQFVVAGTMSFPLVIHAGNSLQVPIRFQPTSFGPKAGTITVSSNDPSTPSKLIAVSGNAPPPDIRVTGSTDFGDVCAEELAEKTVSVCNVGACNLAVTNAAFDPACPDFTLINNPFPATVSPDSCEDLVIRFTPTSAGPKSCNLSIMSDDPDTMNVNLEVTANTPVPSIDVPPDQAFPPEVIQSTGACSTLKPFPISNTGTCNLRISNVQIGGANAGDFGLSGLPSFPIILEPGHIAGEGALQTVFAPTVIDRDRLGNVTVTYVSDPISGATTDVTRALCGEGVRTGARVLVTASGVPFATVEKIHLQRLTANRNKKILDSTDVAMNLPLQTVTPAAPCTPFQFHREYATVSNPIQLAPGSYQVTATAVVGGKRKSKSVGFDVTTCDFNPTIMIDF